MSQHNVKRSHLSKEAQLAKQQKEAKQISHYQALNASVLDSKTSEIYNDETFKKTADLLMLNPEYYSIWNYRRDIISNHYVKTLKNTEDLKQLFEEELNFIILNLKRFPKVYWIWNHRVWILENHPDPKYENELLIVNKLLELDSRNFHGWHYRRFVISKLEERSGQSMSLSEFEYTTSKINKDFSNFSAWHNRTKLIPELLITKPTELFQSVLGFLEKELTYLQNAMYTDPDDQSVWIYLRWLLTSEIFIDKITKEQHINILKKQLSNVKELNQLELEDNEDGKENKWCLKTIVLIETLITKLDPAYKQNVNIAETLNKLIKSDPLRSKLYEDQLSML